MTGLLLLACASQLAATEPSLHQEAGTCRLLQQLSTTCWDICVECHASVERAFPLDLYTTGDAALCASCHPEKSDRSKGNAYLLHLVGGGGGNHSINILYRTDLTRTPLAPAPQGPKLFTDTAGENPKVHCSTCHNAMSTAPMLLRLHNRESTLCRSCHLK